MIPAVIFAGGRGIRLGDSFGSLPKALVKINGKPILQHLIDYLHAEGMQEFYILGGYKIEEIRQYFADQMLTMNVTFNFKENFIASNVKKPDYVINVIDTGVDTSTQSRLFKVKNLLSSYQNVFVTYADGLSDISIKKLMDHHNNTAALATISAVKQESKFGDLEIIGEKVTGFYEKSRTPETWINGGFMIIKREALSMINDSNLMFEQDFLPGLAMSNQLAAYCHTGFWKSMDTPKDHAEFEELFSR